MTTTTEFKKEIARAVVAAQISESTTNTHNVHMWWETYGNTPCLLSDGVFRSFENCIEFIIHCSEKLGPSSARKENVVNAFPQKNGFRRVAGDGTCKIPVVCGQHHLLA